MFLTPGFLAAADQNADHSISNEEFSALGDRWFQSWDTNKSGILDADRIRDGLNISLAPRGFGGPPGAGGPGPGPGGRPGGGPGIGLSLQGAEGKRNGLASAMGIEFEYVHAQLDFESASFTNVAIRYKGNGTFAQSRGSLKRSFKIDLNEFVNGQKLVGISKLNLHNGVTDPSWMNEVLSHQAYRNAGIPAPRTAYARVYITVPGLHDHAYFGLYSLVENVDANFFEERLGSKKGSLFKPVTPNLFADLGDDWSTYRQTYDPKTELSPWQQRRIIDLCKLVTHANDAEFSQRLGDFVDLDAFARYMAVTVWLSTLDSILSIGQNYYLYLDAKTQKFQFVPWDLDHSFGQFPMMGSQEQREKLSIHAPWQQGGNRFLERTFGVAEFKKRYLARLQELSKTTLSPEHIIAQVDSLAPILRPAVQQESQEKLARFDEVVAGKIPSPSNTPGFGGPGFPGFQAPKPIKSFVTARAESVGRQLAGTEPGEPLLPMGMMRPGGPGGRPGPGGRDFGPGTFLADPFRNQLDANQDKQVTRDEFSAGFARWFSLWDADHNRVLDEGELRSGLNTTFAFPTGPGGPAPVVLPAP